jgi:hypothetical protein
MLAFRLFIWPPHEWLLFISTSRVKLTSLFLLIALPSLQVLVELWVRVPFGPRL